MLLGRGGGGMLYMPLYGKAEILILGSGNFDLYNLTAQAQQPVFLYIVCSRVVSS